MKEENKKNLRELSIVTKNRKNRNAVNNAFEGQSFSREVNEYGYYYDEVKRDRVFGLIGKKPVADDIASHVNECDMKYIKEQLLQNGSDIIDEGLMADCSHISNDLLTNLTISETAKQSFYALPKFIREKYNNNIHEFANNFKKEDFVQPIKVEKEETEVIKDENKE